MGAAELLAVLLVVAVCGLLMIGYPVALTLGGVSVLFALIGEATGTMSLGLLGALPQRITGLMMNEVLLAVPLFVFMGVMLERSRVAEELLQTMGRLFGSLPGGLSFSVLLVGVLLAATKGVVGATTVTIALIVLPTMLRHGYDPRLAAGTVAATATLAQVFPPAIVLILLADQLGNAYQSAQLSQGIFAPRTVSVPDLFAGALIPAFALVGLYLLYLIAVAVFRPAMSPAIAGEPGKRGAPLLLKLAEALIAPLALIAAVLGSILAGLATPTEAGAVGAFGAALLAARSTKKALLWLVLLLALVLALRMGGASAALGLLRGGDVIAKFAFGLALAAGAGFLLAPLLWVARAGLLAPVLHRTAQITSMIFVILIGATVFSLVFRGLHGDDLVHRVLSELPGGTAGAIFAVMLAMFLLGFVMDAFEIIFVVVPIVAPPLLKMHGVDPVWLGVMMAVNLQTSYMHPPLGPTLFFLRGAAPPEITTRHIYVGIIPFVLIQLVALWVLWLAPGLATWLPGKLYGG